RAAVGRRLRRGGRRAHRAARDGRHHHTPDRPRGPRPARPVRTEPPAGHPGLLGAARARPRPPAHHHAAPPVRVAPGQLAGPPPAGQHLDRRRVRVLRPAPSAALAPRATRPGDARRRRPGGPGTPVRPTARTPARPPRLPDARRPLDAERHGRPRRPARADRPGRVVHVGRDRPRPPVDDGATARGTRVLHPVRRADRARPRLARTDADPPAPSTPRRHRPVRPRLGRRRPRARHPRPVPPTALNLRPEAPRPVAEPAATATAPRTLSRRRPRARWRAPSPVVTKGRAAGGGTPSGTDQADP